MGSSHTEWESGQPVTVGELRQQLIREFPSLAGNLESALAAVDQQFAFDEELIPDGAEVAFFPPVSGGDGTRTILRVTGEVLNQDELISKITTPTTGAVCVFTGIVRAESSQGASHRTISLEYEAYIPMAEAKMAQVAQEIRQRWPCVEGIAIVQRIGVLPAGTPSVVIACASAHRDTGVFEATRYGIDRLKEIVPVWKKEIGPDGELWIDGQYQVQPGD